MKKKLFAPDSIHILMLMEVIESNKTKIPLSINSLYKNVFKKNKIPLSSFYKKLKDLNDRKYIEIEIAPLKKIVKLKNQEIEKLVEIMIKINKIK